MILKINRLLYSPVCHSSVRQSIVVFFMLIAFLRMPENEKLSKCTLKERECYVYYNNLSHLRQTKRL